MKRNLLESMSAQNREDCKKIEEALINKGPCKSEELMKLFKSDSKDEEGKKRSLRNKIKKLDEIYDGENEVLYRKGHYELANRNYLAFPRKYTCETDDAQETIAALLKVITSFNGAIPIDKIEVFQRFNSLDLQNEMSERFSMDPNPYMAKWISRIYDAISQKKCINITYKQTGKQSITRHVSPYCLKFHAGRWYLIGHLKRIFKKDDPKNFQEFMDLDFEWSVQPLDRIEDIQSSNAEYKDVDFKRRSNYYDHIVGIYAPVKDPLNPPTVLDKRSLDIKEVRIQAKDERTYRSIKTNPIHRKQTCDDEQRTITLKVVLNPPLKKRILSLGSDIKVLSPDELITQIKEESLRMYELYKN